MTVSDIGGILASEFAKISDQIVFFCIVGAIALIVLGLIIRGIKSTFKTIFKSK